MEKSKITIKASLVNGSEAILLENATPGEAINEYFYPDSGLPVQTLSIQLTDIEGKQYSISIYPGGIVVRDVAV